MEKTISDEYSSSKDYFEELVYNPSLCEKKVQTMSSEELIGFYDYVVKTMADEATDSRDNLWLAVMLLEDLPIIHMYKQSEQYVNSTLNNKSFDMVDDTDGLTEEERKEIDATIQLLEERRRPGIVRKLMKIMKR